MKLETFKYTCHDCQTVFTAPALNGEHHYGEFAMCTQHGETAYLTALNSNEFNEVSKIVDANPLVKSFTQMKISDVM